MKTDISHARLLECVTYDGEELRWKIRINNAINVGNAVGSICDCGHGKLYRRVRIDKVRYFVHRLVWFYVHREWPNGQIDHIDGNGLNNAIENMRVVDNKENHKNQRLRKNNTSGVCGVTWNSGNRRWRAQITVLGKNISLGEFTTKDAAIAARKAADVANGFHPNHGTDRPL